mmetsp:Transcript_7054/g.12023  ORF Transcript_7054/g.12023 Transcript_7054/m.12023 type:complete len:205 (-) Transcript_7054:2640-3254(-)
MCRLQGRVIAGDRTLHRRKDEINHHFCCHDHHLECHRRHIHHGHHPCLGLGRQCITAVPGHHKRRSSNRLPIQPQGCSVVVCEVFARILQRLLEGAAPSQGRALPPVESTSAGQEEHHHIRQPKATGDVQGTDPGVRAAQHVLDHRLQVVNQRCHAHGHSCCLLSKGFPLGGQSHQLALFVCFLLLDVLFGVCSLLLHPSDARI